MITKLFQKKEYLIILVTVVLFVLASGLSLLSINNLQGTGRIINYAGMVRGMTQKLVKEELSGRRNDDLLNRLDSIVLELRFGGPQNSLLALDDDTFQNSMIQVSEQWDELKQEILNVREGADSQRLYEMSESCYKAADRAVSAAETYSEKEITLSKSLLAGTNVIFFLSLAVSFIGYLRNASLERRAAQLNIVAYTDGLTQMPNRASCDRLIEQYWAKPTYDFLAVVMFDMNNLKRVNSIRGRQGGDRLIAEFGKIIRDGSEKYGFAGRYGGDEFLCVFENTAQAVLERFLADINTRVVAWNIRQVDEIDKISFAAGYSLGKEGENHLKRLIGEADLYMYEKKQQMVENRD